MIIHPYIQEIMERFAQESDDSMVKHLVCGLLLWTRDYAGPVDLYFVKRLVAMADYTGLKLTTTRIMLGDLDRFVDDVLSPPVRKG